MDFLLNVLHYSIYHFHQMLTKAIRFIIPTHLLHNIPAVKRLYKKNGVTNPRKVIDRQYSDPVYGYNIVKAGSGALLIVFLWFLPFACFIFSGFSKSEPLNVITIGISAFLSGTLCYFFLFRRDRYLLYFDKFDKLSVNKRCAYHLASFLFVVIVVSLQFVNMIYVVAE